MIVHDAILDKPAKSGKYLTFTTYYDVGGFKTTATDMEYDAEVDKWNFSYDADTELFPPFWAELPDSMALLDMAEEGRKCLEF